MRAGLEFWQNAAGVVVGAAKIAKVTVRKSGLCAIVFACRPEQGIARRTYHMPYDRWARDKPAEGWYLVEDGNGKVSFRPPATFEAEFTLTSHFQTANEGGVLA